MLRIKLSAALFALCLVPAGLLALQPAYAQTETAQPAEDTGETLRGDTGVKVLGVTRPPLEPLPERLPSDDLPPISQDSIEPSDEPPPEPPPTYRTMCVRLCDGYFYPMSYAVMADVFERDRKRCDASCPGASMELFYGETVLEDPGRMQSRSTSGYYGDLPTAFLHQKVRAKAPATCTCIVPRKGVDIIAGQPPRGNDEPNILGEINGPVPKARESANDAVVLPVVPSGSVVEIPLPGSVEPHSLPSDAPADQPSGERKVRVVSPALLPDRSEAADRQGPVQP